MKPEKLVNHLSVTCGGESYNSESYNGGSTVVKKKKKKKKKEQPWNRPIRGAIQNEQLSEK
jgi:hypothetical protein